MVFPAPASGEDVNKTFDQAEIEGIDDLEVFDSSGVEVTTTEKAKDAFVENPSGFTFTIRSADGANTHLNIGIKIICITHLEGTCPNPDQGCS
jgi:hypothetical protein